MKPLEDESAEVRVKTVPPADGDGLSLSWLRQQFGWMEQFDAVRIRLDDCYELELEWHDDTAAGPVYYMHGGGSLYGVRVTTVGQVRGLMKLYGVPEKQ
jgi:hypothetical protein